MTPPIETKVAATGLAGTAVLTAFGLIAWLDPSFTNPPAYVTAGLVTIVGAVVGWLAPHTSRLPVQPPRAVPRPPVHFDAGAPLAPGTSLAFTSSGAAAGPPISPPPEGPQP